MIQHGNYLFMDKMWILQHTQVLKHYPSVLDLESANAILVILDSMHTCVGNPDRNFVLMCELRDGKFLSADRTIRAYKDTYCPLIVDDEVYPATVRTTNCDLLTCESKCDQCKNYRSVLRAMHSRQQRTTELIINKRSEISSHTNFRYLTQQQQIKRISNLRKKNNITATSNRDT